MNTRDDVAGAAGDPQNPALKIGRAIFSAACLIAAMAAAAALLHAAWCAYTNGKFYLIDYGLYSGAVWNTAHGHPFQVLNGESYLNRHLTFSLVLLAPIVWITDHPLMLSFMQWALAVTGVALLVVAARKQKIGWPVAAVTAAFCLLSPLTQDVLLAEVHGVGFMLFALPWLYYVARFKPSLTWLPLIVLCGLREESGIYAAALLFALAWQQRSRRLALYAVASVLYVIIAIKLLYPLCNDGLNLFDRRGNVAHVDPIRMLHWEHIRIRGVPTLHIILLALPLVLLRPGIFSILCGVPLIVCYFSPGHNQYIFRLHYAAPIAAALGVIIVMAYDGCAKNRWHRGLRLLAPLWLLAGAIFYDAERGFFWPARNIPHEYGAVGDDGREELWLARHIPKDGLLLCDGHQAAYSADREAIEDIRLWTNAPALPRFLFSTLGNLRHADQSWIRTALTNGSLRVLHFDGNSFIATAGPPAGPEKLVHDLANTRLRTLLLPHAPLVSGKKLFVPGAGECVQWTAERAVRTGNKIVVSGISADFAPGDYTAVLFMKTPATNGTPGSIEFLAQGQTVASASLAITNADPASGFGYQIIPISVAQTNTVEARITGGTVPLTLNRLLIIPKPDAP